MTSWTNTSGFRMTSRVICATTHLVKVTSGMSLSAHVMMDLSSNAKAHNEPSGE